MIGATYAFNTVVEVRSYSRNSGTISLDTETGSPDSPSPSTIASATARSWAGFA